MCIYGCADFHWDEIQTLKVVSHPSNPVNCKSEQKIGSSQASQVLYLVAVGLQLVQLGIMN